MCNPAPAGTFGTEEVHFTVALRIAAGHRRQSLADTAMLEAALICAILPQQGTFGTEEVRFTVALKIAAG